MIVSKAFDVEIFPNLFSVTFVDVKDYLQKFADCEGALTDTLTVKEIKKRLDEVKCDVFYISDTDDSQLLNLVSYLNKMQAHYITNEDKDANISQVPVRYDLFGFNTLNYDNLMIAFFLMSFNRYDNTKYLIKALYEFSKKIIRLQDNHEAFYQDNQVTLARKYRLPFASVDLFKVFHLDAASARADKDTGERIKLSKGLKGVSINLKWYELLDFKLPPIDEEEVKLYWSNKPEYKGCTAAFINNLGINDFDRYVLPKYVSPMLHYNKNDVFIVCEMIRQKPDEIKLRYSIEHAFGIHVLSSARSDISKKLLTKLYSKATGLSPRDFEKKRTERTKLSFKKIIFPHIKFKTKQLQDLLESMKKVSIYRTNKDSFSTVVDFMGTKYNIATGGIHSIDAPRELRSNDNYVYIHHDYVSYYPSIMISYNIAPAHLNNKKFVELIDYLKSTRVKCKHAKPEDGMIIPGVHNNISAQALKIVINAIYGMLGFEKFWLYDRFAQMQVTINGQLMTMSLVEALELEGIHTVSANTDGIVVKVPRDKIDKFKEICDNWNKENKMSADDDYYKCYVDRDINNYYDILEGSGKVEFKGQLDPKQYIKDLSKGFDMPIVRTAAFEYLEHNIPVMTTLRQCTDILDFCKTQNVGKQFEVIYDKVVNGKIVTVHSQRHVRFYVSYNGVIIQKEDTVTKKRSRLASGNSVTILNTLDDKPIAERNINYTYYYNEAYKLISPIKLGISPNQKGDKNKGIKSGKALLKKYGNDFRTLFDEIDV